MPDPVIISNGGGPTASISFYENTVGTLSLLDGTVTGEFTFSIDGGADAAFFEIVSLRVLRFIAPPDFETPLDDDEDNVYEVVIKLTDTVGFDTQVISVTILDRDEIHPTWISNPVIGGFPFPTRPTTHSEHIHHRLLCSDGDVTVGTLVKSWYRDDDGAGTNITLVGTGDSYVVQTADIDKWLRCIVVATNGEFTGEATADWTPSVWSALSVSPGIMQVYDPVSVPAGTNVTTVQDLDALRGLYVLTNHDISDVDAEEMPSPPLDWDESGAQADIDFGFFAVSASVGEILRNSAKCPTLIAQSFAVSAAHFAWQGGQAEFMEPDGTIQTRSCTMVLNETVWFPGDKFGDIVVYKLNAPVTTVEPVAILADISALESAMVLDIELNRHLTGYIITDDGLGETVGDNPLVYLIAVDEDVVDPGDSCTPVFTVIDGMSVLLGCVNGAYLDGENVPNLSFFLPELATIVASGGESLTILNLSAGGAGRRRKLITVGGMAL